MVHVRRTILVFVRIWLATLLLSFAVRGARAIGIEVSQTVTIVVLVVGALLGLAVGLGEARDTPPWNERDLRDGAVGWGVIAALLFVTPCLFLPLPWSPAAAAGVGALVLVTVLFVRRHAARLGRSAQRWESRTPSAADRPAA